MNKKSLPIFLVLIILVSFVPTTLGNSNGKYSSGSGCGCHYGSSATVTMSGQPSSYTPGSTYTLSISVSNGVSGTKGGFSLEASSGTLTTAGTVGIMSVKVNSAGTSATHTTSSYRSWSVDWIAPSTGTGNVQFKLAAMTANGNGGTGGDAWGTTTINVPEAAAAPNNAPTASNLQLSPSNPVTSDTLTLSYSYQDQDNDTESGTEIRWYKDGVLEPSRNDMATIAPSYTSKGEQWNVTVTPSDGEDYGTPIHSESLLIVNSIPLINSAEINPSPAVDTDNLSIDWIEFDADGDNLSVSGVEWYVDGSKVSAFDGDLQIPSVAIRDGDIWHAKIKINDGEDDSAWFTTQDILVGSSNNAPTMTSVSIEGQYTTLDDLIATATADDIDGDLLTFEWQWLGTNFDTDTLPSSETSKGQIWKVKSRVTDGLVYSDWMESNSVIIQNSAPILNSLSIDQETIFFESEATYTYDAYDADGDQLFANEVWNRVGDNYTLTLTINDIAMAVSNELSDSVQIVNSLPIVEYDGPISQDALSDIMLEVTSSDPNGDDVTVYWEWTRNGFETDYNQSTIPSSNLGAGDIWIATVTPYDGIDFGEALSIQITINNTGPSAVITPPKSLIEGAVVTFSASESTDLDGTVVNAIWSVDGEVVHSGLAFDCLMTNQLALTVRVIDNLGAFDITSSVFIGEEPPTASNVDATIDDSIVKISWSGQAESWAIVHNGDFIDSTNTTRYEHAPVIEGNHTYNILPIVDGQIIQWIDETSTVTVELTSSSVPEAPGPSDLAGIIFSIAILILGIAGVTISFIPRRE